ncbi:hypothetical protein [Halodesulfovibrio sp.]|uniref:hypothetical protein n=1 Tax=Halodesulfovibrio sp. TaxID=1912772 RepID=UPI0025BD3180|nr:hypothetical protein [Halodesulfovibrio sp.]
MYSYVFSYNPDKLKKRTVFDFLNECEEVAAWLSPFAGTVIVISNSSAEDLSELFSDEFGEANHLFVDIQDDEPDYQGWLDEEAWDYINSPDDYE